jgi:hypothetical protein
MFENRGGVTCLASRRWRIFLIAWMLYTIHFATNVVREHYPAFSIAEHGTFRVDGYEGFHADIFVHRDGHAVIGNQVLVSVLAAVPLFIFDPVLDALEQYSKSRLAAEGNEAEYRTVKPIRRAFFQLVRDRGLDLRFGAATAITTAFLMAPATALFLVFFYDVLKRRGVDSGEASALAFLLGFGTPLFFRTSTLNHNLFVMYAMFAAFVLLWTKPGEPVSARNRLLAGFFGGLTIATDYVGVVILPLLYAYLVLPRARAASWRASLSESALMVLGSIPPVLFLLYSQWAMYGNPFLPGQYWMPDQNIYVNEGLRGFTLPAPDLFFQNLFHPGFGMFTWSPVLLLALVPVAWYARDTLILPTRERWFVIAAAAAILLFSSANQYARLQWNSGFRYLLPLVPFLMLAIADHWIRLAPRVKMAIAAGAVIHSWVLTVYREPVPLSWRLLFVEGPQLPWYRVLSMTSNPDSAFVGTWWLPSILLAATLGVAAGIWKYGANMEVARDAC